MRAAILDVGSNTVRLLVAEQSNPGLQTIAAEGEHLGLASDIERDGWISGDKLEQARELALRYATVARECRALSIEVVVTAPGRQAANAEALVEALEEGAAAPVRVLSAQEEGSLPTPEPSAHSVRRRRASRSVTSAAARRSSSPAPPTGRRGCGRSISALSG
jgi:exopolyphosphatase/pppGpp-phosphohydrolase